MSFSHSVSGGNEITSHFPPTYFQYIFSGTNNIFLLAPEGISKPSFGRREVP